MPACPVKNTCCLKTFWLPPWELIEYSDNALLDWFTYTPGWKIQFNFAAGSERSARNSGKKGVLGLKSCAGSMSGSVGLFFYFPANDGSCYSETN